MQKNEAHSSGERPFRNQSCPEDDATTMDALVIQAMVANYDVRRVFVDSGSSVNVIFQKALDHMNLEGNMLEPIETALFGFFGHTVYHTGEIMLPLTVGAES